eukprot:3933470-Pyramimonas_sp.AAC.1
MRRGVRPFPAEGVGCASRCARPLLPRSAGCTCRGCALSFPWASSSSLLATFERLRTYSGGARRNNSLWSPARTIALVCC